MEKSKDRLEHVKERMRGTWMAGDFGRIARYMEKSAADFVERLSLQPTLKILDVACGTGNLTVPAARKGARVWGVDIAPNLLEQARERAAVDSLTIDFTEGDAEQLAFGDAEFDVVMTMFGAMFAPRPEVVAGELARVCKPGGRIAMANWTPAGFVGRMFAVGSRHVPPPAGVPAPVQWGDEQIVRERLGPHVSAMRFSRHMASFDFPFPPAEVVQFFRRYFGPVQVAFSRLDAAGQSAYAADLEQLWRDNNQGGEQGGESRTLIPAEFLEVVAIRA